MAGLAGGAGDPAADAPQSAAGAPAAVGARASRTDAAVGAEAPTLLRPRGSSMGPRQSPPECAPGLGRAAAPWAPGAPTAAPAAAGAPADLTGLAGEARPPAEDAAASCRGHAIPGLAGLAAYVSVAAASLAATAGGGAWADDPCEWRLPYVCEVEGRETCDTSFVQELGSCYWRGDDTLTFDEAEGACRRGGGHLASAQSAAENQVVIDMCDGVHYGFDRCWIGLRRPPGEDSWEWTKAPGDWVVAGGAKYTDWGWELPRRRRSHWDDDLQGRVRLYNPLLEPVCYLSAPLPVALFVGWCIGQRRRLQRGVATDQWTGRYGIIGAIFVFLMFTSKVLLRSYLPVSLEPVILLLIGTVYGVMKTICCHLVVVKLRTLGHTSRARAALICEAAWLSSGILFFVLHGLYVSLAAHLVLLSAAFLALLIAVLSMALQLALGFSGLVESARREARSSSPTRRRAAAWVGLTVVCAALSFVGTVTWIFVFLTNTDIIIQVLTVFGDFLFDCMGVATMSGLVGPPEIRRLAIEAFEQINSFSADELQEFYGQYLTFLDAARVKWVRCAFLRRLAARGALLPRCQDVPAGEAVLGSEGFPRNRGARKGRFVVSHPWLAKHHPDPDGVKLRQLVDQLDALGADDADAVFVDYCGLPQHDMADPELQLLAAERRWPAPGTHRAVRSEADEASFKEALGSMELLYSVGSTPVIVLPMDEATMGGREGTARRSSWARWQNSSMAEFQQATMGGREYISRGWCLLEFCLALSFGNVANADTHEPVKQLCDRVLEMKGDTVDGFQEVFERTTFTESGDSDKVQRLFAQTINKKSTGP